MGAGQSGLSDDLLASHHNLGVVHNYKAIQGKIGTIKTNGIKLDNLNKNEVERAKKSVLSRLEKEMKNNEKKVLNMIKAKNMVNQNRLRVQENKNNNENSNKKNNEN